MLRSPAQLQQVLHNRYTQPPSLIGWIHSKVKYLQLASKQPGNDEASRIVVARL